MKREIEKFLKFYKKWDDEYEAIIPLVELLKSLHKEGRMKFHKSPYGDSFYLTKRGEEIGWEHKPEGSYRLSDHWGWEQKKFDGEIIVHCPIDGSEEEKNTWHLCRWENGIYKIIK